MTEVDINMEDWSDPPGSDPDPPGHDPEAFRIGFAPQEDDAAAEKARDVTPASDANADNAYHGLEHALEPGDVKPENPSEIGYPPTLPIEVALQTAPDDRIREAYGFTPAQWWALKRSSQFKRDLADARTMLRSEGMSFRAKARLQSEELLATSWQMIHDPKTPASVRADLLKFTVRAAGLEAKAEDKGETTTPLQINIAL